MAYFTQHPKARWIAPAAAAVLIAGGSMVASQATADPSLPPRTAEELLVDLQQSEPSPMSGTVVQTANLGLPELPSMGGQAGPGQGSSGDFTALLSGSHTLRAWYDGPDRVRLALVGTSEESDIIRNGRDLWLWSSGAKEAVHYTLPEGSDHAAPDPARLPLTPEEAAEKVLTELEPTTTVTIDGTATVAGRSAYELVLDPKSGNTLVDDVRIAVDAEEDIPLRVQVNSTKTEEPAFEVGFTDVDFTAPEPRMFEFTPPEGTTVTERTADEPAAAPGGDAGKAELASPLGKPTVVGSGWDSVAIMKLSQPRGDDDTRAQLLEALPRVSGNWGSGRLLTGTVFSAVVTDDGRLAIGMVAPERVYDALDGP